MPKTTKGQAVLSRRKFNQLSCTALMAGAFSFSPKISLAANPVERKLHGLSAFGELKYKQDYSHFDFVNPEAPKGGTMVFQPSYWYYNQNTQTYNTLNSFVLKGDSPPRMEYCFDSLMAASYDEADSFYGLLAEWVEISKDRNRYRFKIRDEAKFHDGSPLTADDVAFSFKLLRDKGHPTFVNVLINLTDVEIEPGNVASLIFNGQQSDRAILSAVAFPILSKAYYQTHDFEKSTLEPPLGSGPYRVGNLNPGVFIEYERVENYWAKDMPFKRGLNNFQTLRIEFYAERSAAFEAFKKGKIHWREEFTSKTWATGYDFPAVNENKIIKREFSAEKNPSFQAWAFNTRREKFSDPRVRQAIGLCFDFEWTNKNLFFNAYQRASSMFENSDLKATAMPDAAELALLNPFRDILPEDTFGEAVTPMQSDGTGKDRIPLRQALSLLVGAGYKRQGGKMVDAKGQQLAIEFLLRSSSLERILNDFINNLNSLGIDAKIRLIDSAQYQTRVETFDFDIIMNASSLSPNISSETLRNLFGSHAAKRNGSLNHAGIKNPVVDHLIERVEQAEKQSELITITRALDRVLRAQHYFIPNWYADAHRVAHWDRFGYKMPKPDYFFPPEQLWWQDDESVKKLEEK